MTVRGQSIAGEGTWQRVVVPVRQQRDRPTPAPYSAEVGPQSRSRIVWRRRNVRLGRAREVRLDRLAVWGALRPVFLEAQLFERTVQKAPVDPALEIEHRLDQPELGRPRL